MTLKTKRILFYSLLLLFLLASPLLIAYSVGYTVNLTEGRLEKTGGIFIKSKTTSLSIFLNGTFIKESSFLSGGALLTDVLPGMHRLRLEKANYYPWSKTISVEPQLVTDIRDIVMVRTPISAATSTAEDLAVIRQSAEEEKQAIDDKQKRMTTLFPSAPYLDKKSNLIFKSGTTTRTVSANVHSFDLVGDTLFFVDKNGFLARTEDLTSVETIGRPGFYLTQKTVQFFRTQGGLIFMRDSANGLFLYDGTAISSITGNVQDILPDGDENKVLLRKDQSVEVLWLEDHSFQPFQKKGTQEEVIAPNVPILDAVWYYADNAHIIFRTRDGIFFAEIDGRGGRNIVKLVSGKTDDLLTFTSMPNAIFYRQGKVFYKIEL